MPRSDRTRRILAGLLAVFGLFAIGCGGSRGNAPPPQTANPIDTRLGPGDTFEIAVYEEKELSGKFQVAEDGSINFPFIGLVPAAGKTPIELAQDIQVALKTKQVLRNPSVSIFVLDYGSKKVTVVGAVNKPGSFPVTNGMSAVQAVSLAGGLTGLAAANDAVVTRRVAGKLVRYSIALGKASEGRADDLVLQSGDIVFVPERLF